MRLNAWTIFLSLVVIGASVAAFEAICGILAATTLLELAAYRRWAHRMPKRARNWYRLLLVMLLFACLVASFARPVQLNRESVRRTCCARNLRELAAALRAYHDEHGCFPPAYFRDTGDRPILSWRVTLLPYTNCKDILGKCDLCEPWNGPHNARLTDFVPCYRCRNDHSAIPSYGRATSYLAVVGPHTAWPGGTSAKLSDMRHEGRQTILLVEAAESGIHWMESRDLSFAEAACPINSASGIQLRERTDYFAADLDERADPKSTRGIRSSHIRWNGFFCYEQTGAHVAFADGTVRFLPDDFPVETLKTLLTRDGGEEIDIDAMVAPRPRWDKIISVVVLTLAFGLLLFRPRARRDRIAGGNTKPE